MSGGWWRRNRWGLTVLLPFTLLSLALPAHDMYAQFWDSAPRTPVLAAADGWVPFAGANIRLTSLAPATHLTDDFHEPITPPVGMSIWRASIAFRSTDASTLAGCDLRLVDAAGTTYDANPAELTDLSVGANFASCSPDTLTGKPPTSWTTSVYFVAPTSARPTGVQVLIDTELPRYALLTPH